MMPQIVSKAEFARMMNVTPSAVANWIARGKISGKALVGDEINVRVAKRQLENQIALNRLPVAVLPTRAAPAQSESARRIADAKVTKAEVEAELSLRRLEEARGRYVLASAVTETMTRGFATLISTIETRFEALDRAMTDVGGIYDPRRARAWWMETRSLLGAELAARREQVPEFVADPEL